jgi:hypothetical protein
MAQREATRGTCPQKAFKRNGGGFVWSHQAKIGTPSMLPICCTATEIPA